jgi:hypothetical protein
MHTQVEVGKEENRSARIQINRDRRGRQRYAVLRMYKHEGNHYYSKRETCLTSRKKTLETKKRAGDCIVSSPPIDLSFLCTDFVPILESSWDYTE